MRRVAKPRPTEIARRPRNPRPGKVANLIVTTGDPLDLQTDVRYLFINGRLAGTDNKHRQLYEEYRKRP